MANRYLSGPVGRLSSWVGCLAVGVALVHGACAMAAEPSFSAQVVRVQSGKEVVQGRMFVSAQGVRSETVKDGQPVWMVFRPDLKRAWLLFPNLKQYLEFSDGDMGRPPLPDDVNSPCHTNAAYSCRPLQREVVNGRQVQKWEINVKAGQNIDQSFMWVDPEFRMSIRESYPGGLIVELRDFQTAPLSGKLFEIPDGFQPVPAPADGVVAPSAPPVVRPGPSVGQPPPPAVAVPSAPPRQPAPAFPSGR